MYLRAAPPDVVRAPGNGADRVRAAAGLIGSRMTTWAGDVCTGKGAPARCSFGHIIYARRVSNIFGPYERSGHKRPTRGLDFREGVLRNGFD